MDAEVRRYRVIEAIGRGGFGTVYRAELLGPSGFKKQVALKVLNPDAPEAVGVAERLRDEARVLGMLRHRAIVQVDGLHLLNGRWTVVMEYVDGVDLRQLLAEGGPVPPGIALEIVQEVANALHYAFEMSVDRSVSMVAPTGSLRLLHRDIKPGNVQLTAAGEVKVLDFGVARADFADREAQTQSIYFGSLNYMSPERLDGIDDHKGDIYALGAVLYELVMGEPLGRTSASRDRHDARLREALNGLWEAQPDEDLYRLVAECLLYDPDARPTARELERACRSLRPRFGAPWLSEWAEEQVPTIMEAREPIDDDLSGATLIEAGGISGGITSGVAPKPARKEDADKPAAKTRSSRAFMVVAIAGLVALVVVGGGLALTSWLWGGTGPEAVGDDALDALGQALEADPMPDDDPVPDDFEITADAQPLSGSSSDPAPLDEQPATTAAAQPTPSTSTALDTTASTAPSSTAPSSTAPSSTAPSSTAPSSTAPSSTAPSSTAPSSTAPASTAPASTAPASTAPASTAPASTSSGSTTAETADPAGSPSVGTPSTSTPSSGSATSGSSTASPAVAAPDPEPDPEPATPTAETSSASGAGTVRIVRGANTAEVVLVGAGGRYPVGRVPAGKYTIEATFADGTVDRSVSVTVSDGGSVKLSCVAGMKKCLAI